MKKSKKTKINPAEALGNIQREKMGMAQGSMLEGGSIKYKNGGPRFPKKGNKSSVLGLFGTGLGLEAVQSLFSGDAARLRADRLKERDNLMKEGLSKRDAMKQARKNIKN